jgi:23S rRNA pseudouridine955/2504/2580 synthase
MEITLSAAVDDEGRRLDRVLRKALPELPLSLIHRLLRKGRILVDGRPGKGADRIRAGARILIPEKWPEGSRESLEERADRGACSVPKKGRAVPLDILREAGGLLFINKAPGIVVHGRESLEDLVRSYLAEKLPPSLSFRPGPLHRLDKATSGVIVFSVTLEGARYFSALLRERRVKKQYLALADGKLDAPAVWEDSLVRDRQGKKTLPAAEDEGAKKARTRVVPLASSSRYSLILAEIETGRTHQIRAQGALHGFPLAGDRKYGGSFLQGGFLLHAYTLEFREANSPEPLILTAPPPERFRQKIVELFPEKYKKSAGSSARLFFS